MKKVLLTVRDIAQVIEQAGWGKLPSGSHFHWLGKDLAEAEVTMPYPKGFYVKANTDGEIIRFKVIL